ncbi:unnamed protein product [Rhodiola kirilowii]
MWRAMDVFVGVLLSLFLATNFAIAAAAAGLHHQQQQQPYEAIFNFGDSLSDVGNLIVANPKAFSVVGKLPYGQTYFGRPTGRCSDGRLIVDFLAEAYGLPFMPPYLNLSKPEDGLRGTNFAVAGATALDKSFYIKLGIGSLLWTNESLATQVAWFQKLKPSLCSTNKECDAYLKKSLFLVGEIGANDYNYVGLTGAGSEELRKMVPQVIESISNAVTTLVQVGAVNIVVPGNVPLGCSPVYLTFLQSDNKKDYNRYGCLTAFNSLAIYHNQLLLASLAKLRKAHPHARIMYADYYKAGMRFVYAPAHFGFNKNNKLRACCGGGGQYNVDFGAWCGMQGAPACMDPSKYAAWDGLHLTEAAYRHMTVALINGSVVYPPMAQPVSAI